MSDELEASTYLGSALTNTKPGSDVTVQDDAVYSVRYQFIPAGLGPHAALAGAGNSTTLKGSLVHFSPANTRLPPLANFRLGPVVALEYLDAAGSLKKAKGHVVELTKVKSGDTVTLYYGRDALPGARKVPVFVLKSIAANTVVSIFEKPGKLGHKPDLALTGSDTEGTRWYEATLSGDTWWECTPPFTVQQAEALLAAEGATEPHLCAAISAIYGESLAAAQAGNAFSTDLAVQGAAHASAAGSIPAGVLRLTWSSGGCDAGSNCGVNVASHDPKSVLTRVHPLGYAAIIRAAVQAGLRGVQFTSSWRPMLGSCAHRHGIGVDVGSITDAAGKAVPMRWQSLSAKEKETWDAMKEAQDTDSASQTDLREARRRRARLAGDRDKQAKAVKAQQQKLDELTGKLNTLAGTATRLAGAPKLPGKAGVQQEAALLKAEKDVATQRGKVTAQQEVVAKKQAALDKLQADLDTEDQAVKEAEANAKASKAERQQSEAEWDKAVASNQPVSLVSFRGKLAADALVEQLFDPWFLDSATGDSVAATANRRQSGLETLHLSHLHITCRDSALRKFG